MNTELEMSSNYHHGQEPQQNVLTPVHFNGGAYRQVPPQNHHQIPTHFTGTGYEHQSTPNRRLPVDMYQATSPYIRTAPPPLVQFNDNESVLGGSISTIDTNTTVPSSYEVMIRKRITLDSHCSVNPTLFNIELIRSVCDDDPDHVYKIGIDKSSTYELCDNLFSRGLVRVTANKLHSNMV